MSQMKMTYVKLILFSFLLFTLWLDKINTRCHEKTTANLVDVPEESCDLQPQKTCGLDHDVALLLDYLHESMSIDNHYGAPDGGILISRNLYRLVTRLVPSLKPTRECAMVPQVFLFSNIQGVQKKSTISNNNNNDNNDNDNAYRN